MSFASNGCFWSVMIPVYNPSEDDFRTALKGVLTQDPGPSEMQIEVVDDQSPQVDVERLVREIGGGRISFFRQPKNVGLAENWNTCIRRARGKYVHILHQDDVVLPGFYGAIQQGFESDSAIGAAYCRHAYINPSGHWVRISDLESETAGRLEDFLPKIAVGQRLECPSIAVRRSVYEAIGLFSTELVFSLDWEMWRRIACKYPVWYEPRILACYRFHPANATSRLARDGTTVRDVGKSIRLIEGQLPPEKARVWSRLACENYALLAIGFAWGLVAQGDISTAKIQVREAIRLSPTYRVLRAAMNFRMMLMKCLFRRITGLKKV